MRNKSKKTEFDEDKRNRLRKTFEPIKKKPVLNCQNTIFGFTKILWLINSKNTIKQIINDEDGKMMVEKYLSVSSLLLRYHFDFVCFFDFLSKVEVSKINFFLFFFILCSSDIFIFIFSLILILFFILFCLGFSFSFSFNIFFCSVFHFYFSVFHFFCFSFLYNFFILTFHFSIFLFFFFSFFIFLFL